MPAHDSGLPLDVCTREIVLRSGRIISSCTGLLLSGPNKTGASQAALYYARGLAHVQKFYCGGGTAAYSDAVADLGEAVRQEPSFREAYAARALAHEYQGAHMKAMGDYRRAYRIGIPAPWLVERLEIIENAP